MKYVGLSKRERISLQMKLTDITQILLPSVCFHSHMDSLSETRGGVLKHLILIHSNDFNSGYIWIKFTINLLFSTNNLFDFRSNSTPSQKHNKMLNNFNEAELSILAVTF